MTDDHATTTEHFVAAGGRRGRVLVAGEGPPVVLLASALVRAESYRPTRRHLVGRGFRVFAVEMPGCGLAERLPAPWLFRDYGRWLIEFLAALRERSMVTAPPVVIGHSNSGPPAVVAAAERPDLLSKLVLVGSVGFDEAHSLAGVLLRRGVDTFLEPGLSAWGWPHVLSNAVWHTRNALRQTRMAATTDLTAVAPRVRTPTLLAWGALDHTMPAWRCPALAHRLIPGSRLYLSPGTSHDWLITNPDEFAAVVKTFAGGAEI